MAEMQFLQEQKTALPPTLYHSPSASTLNIVQCATFLGEELVLLRAICTEQAANCCHL